MHNFNFVNKFAIIFQYFCQWTNSEAKIVTERYKVSIFSLTDMDSLARIASNPSSPTVLAELAAIARALQAQPLTTIASEGEREHLQAEIAKLDSVLAPSVATIADLIHDLNVMRKWRVLSLLWTSKPPSLAINLVLKNSVENDVCAVHLSGSRKSYRAQLEVLLGRHNDGVLEIALAQWAFDNRENTTGRPDDRAEHIRSRYNARCVVNRYSMQNAPLLSLCNRVAYVDASAFAFRNLKPAIWVSTVDPRTIERTFRLGATSAPCSSPRSTEELQRFRKMKCP